ncbi:MAG TPA: HD domain-containing protein [Lacipirellulaceae bacterium]|nr:HD domain-containing protein [Lacipirellulaceae bacterium]
MAAAQRQLIDTDPESPSVARLCELAHGQEADFFALLAAKETQTTKDGKPYFRVAFRDAAREVSFPIWSDAPLARACRDEWEVGAFYKLRALYRDTNYGPQLDIRRIRPAVDADAADGFDPAMCLPRSRRDPAEMFAELRDLIDKHIADPLTAAAARLLLDENHQTLLKLPAATHNHHAYAGGFLEHVLSVVETCIYLAEKYAAALPDLDPPLEKDLVVAGGLLHDIGKVRELQLTPAGAEYSASGALIGHILQGRDMLREAAATVGLEGDRLLRLEHIIVAHQRLAEWGAPKPPMTPEALLVHYADDMDAKLQMMAAALGEDAASGPLTSSRNALRQRFYRGACAADKRLAAGRDEEAADGEE